jgi:MFS family permease
MQISLRSGAVGAASLPPFTWAPGRRFAPGSMLLARNRPLRLIFAAGLVSGLGDRLNVVALAALVLARTDSMFYAGMTFVVSTLPYVVFGLFAGTLVDRWDRRWCMVGADVARMVLVALMPLAAVASLPLVYALLFAATCARMIFSPAQHATVPDLVDREDLIAANALVRSGQHATDVVGYPLAGALVTGISAAFGPTGGPHFAFALDAASFAVSAALLWRLPTVGHVKRAMHVERFWTQVVVGATFLVTNPVVRANTVLLTIGPLLLGSLHTLHVAFAWRLSETGATGYAILQGAMGAGVIAALCVVQPLSKRLNKGRTIVLGFSLYGAAILLTGLTTSLPLAALLAAVNGAGNILFIIPSVTLVQQQTPAELRGRVFGVRASLTYAAFAASNALVALWLDDLGVGSMMVVLGGAVLLMAVVASFIRSAREAN